MPKLVQSSIKIAWIFVLILTLSACSEYEIVSIDSPDNKVHIDLQVVENELTYKVISDGKEIIGASEINILPGSQVKILSIDTKEVKETWKPVWGQFSEIENHYKESTVTIDFEGVIALLFVRVYDHGVAFRFEIENIPEYQTPSFLIEYNLNKKDQFYMPAGEREPLGPIVVEKLSNELNKIKFQMPLVVETDQGQFLSLLESDLVSSPGFEVINFEFDSVKQSIISRNEFSASDNKLITPWRLILVEDHIGNLLTNTIPQNVAAPNKIADPSWIKPGKTLWDWRVHGYTAKDGFTYGVDTESYMRFIDFAAKKGIEYFLIDDAWHVGVSPGAITVSPNLDLDKVSKYAAEKGVSLILYYDRKEGNFGDKELLPYYQSLGMKGIKYGFMGKNVPFSRKAIQLSAESKMIIDFHDGPVPFTGVSRTYPNALTREYCHAQQDSRRAFTPETFVKMALINAIQGPLDMNNGIYDITGTNAGERQKGPKKLNSLFTTVTGETARTLIIFSGLVCIPDAPEEYQEKSDLFEFIQKMPVGKWDDSKILNAKMGEYITTARRHGKDWFIGSVHAKGGVLEIPTDYLEEDITYDITYYEDTDETDSSSNQEAYQVRKEIIKKGQTIHAKIATGSGHCVWIRPQENN